MKLYFVKYKRPVNGQVFGFKNWKDGFHGPHTEGEARRIMALVGGTLVPVEIEDAEALLDKVKARAESGETLSSGPATPSIHTLRDEYEAVTGEPYDGVMRLAKVKEALAEAKASQEEEAEPSVEELDYNDMMLLMKDALGEDEVRERLGSLRPSKDDAIIELKKAVIAGEVELP